MAALPTTNISVSLVKNTIGTSSTDLGTLCKHTLVNMYSKYKPVSVAKLEGLTENDFKNANYGFIINSNMSNNFTGIWGYLRPTGGVNSPYRLGDFRGYDHNESEPIKISDNYLNQFWNVFESSTITLTVTPSYKTNSSSIAGGVNNRLTVQDLKISNNGTYEFKNTYFALAYYNSSASRYEIVNANNPINATTGVGVESIASTSLETAIKNLANDTTITLYPFLNTSNGKNSSTLNGNLGYIVPLPKLQAILFKKINKFWLRFDPALVNINNNNNLNFNINQKTSGYENLSTYKTTITGCSDTSYYDLSFRCYIYGNEITGNRTIDLKNLKVNSSLFGNSDYVIVNKMLIETKLEYASSTAMPTITQINQTINYSDTNSSYIFTGAQPPNIYPNTRYMMKFFINNVKMQTLRYYAINDSSLPVAATYDANFGFKYRNEDIPTGLWVTNQRMVFRFS